MYNGKSNYYKKRPYIGKSRKEIRDVILSKQVSIKKNDIPQNWSFEAIDFANKVFFQI